jgi:hypothetical protein
LTRHLAESCSPDLLKYAYFRSSLQNAHLAL